MKYQVILGGLVLGGLLAFTAPIKANTITFSDDFSSGLGNWSGPYGEVVSDSSYGHALCFTHSSYSGDLCSSDFTCSSGECINFAYKGSGGCVGIGNQNPDWLAGYGFGSEVNLADSDSWCSYSIYIPKGGCINLEDFNWGFGPCTGEFADITCSYQPIQTCPGGNTPVSAPDSATTSFLLGGAFLGLNLLRRKLS